jgi:hypothetical protein
MQRFRIAFFVICAFALAGAAQAAGITVTGPAGTATLTPADIAKLPAITEQISFASDHGKVSGDFTGPLLWTVLTAAQVIDPKKPKELGRAFLLLTGADKYSAVLAAGEIAPLFEDKKVLLATAENGKPLTPANYRIVVPGDSRGGRSVHNIVSITVSIAGAPHGA